MREKPITSQVVCQPVSISNPSRRRVRFTLKPKRFCIANSESGRNASANPGKTSLKPQAVRPPERGQGRRGAVEDIAFHRAVHVAEPWAELIAAMGVNLRP